MEIKVTVESPDIAGAINNLADAIRGLKLGAEPVGPIVSTSPAVVAPVVDEIPVAVPEPVPAPAPVPVPEAIPVMNEPEPAPAPVPAPAPAPEPAPAPAPAPVPAEITLESISRAGAGLVDAGKMPDIMAALKKFGVQAITQLKPEEYEAFAAELRALGAQI